MPHTESRSCPLWRTCGRWSSSYERTRTGQPLKWIEGCDADWGVKPMETRIRLCENRGETSNFVDAKLKENGDLELSAQDVGALPLEFWGDDDYEYWVTVPAEQKDRVLLALIEKLYTGNVRAVDDFRLLLQMKGIPHEFMTWI